MKRALYTLSAFILLLAPIVASAQTFGNSLYLETSRLDGQIVIQMTASNPNTPIRITRNDNIQNLIVGTTAMSITIQPPGSIIQIEGDLAAITCNGGELTAIKTDHAHSLNRLIANNNPNIKVDLSIFPNLSALSMTGCRLKEIDLTANAALTNINLNNNELKSLDLSACTSLSRVQFMNNGLNACALDAIYRTLPTLSITPATVNLYNGTLNDTNEVATSHTKIAAAKNWRPNFHGDASGCTDPSPERHLSFFTPRREPITFHIAFSYEGKHPYMIDWGNGVTQTYQATQVGDELTSVTGTPTADKIKVYGDLKHFDLTHAGITAIDTRSLPRLEYLGLRRNDIAAIDLSYNTNLRSLYLRGNQLTSLDLSHCPQIEHLYIRENQLTSIDLVPLPRLKELAISHNPLNHLDITSLPELTKLYAMGLGLTSLDLSQSANLYQLEIGGNKLTSLDIAACPLLGYLNIEQNHFSACALDSIYRMLPIPNRPIGWKNLLIGEGDNDAIHSYTDIAVQRGWVPTVHGDGSGCDVIYEKPAAIMNTAKQIGETFALSIASPAREFALDLGDGHILRYNPQPTLSFIPAIKVAGQTIKIYGQGITELVMTNDKLTQLDLPHASQLNYLQCSANELTSIDLSSLPALQRLYISKNKLQSLDIKSNPELCALFVRSCLLSAQALQSLYADLPNVQNQAITAANEDYMRRLAIEGNPGATQAPNQTAIDKGWIVDLGLITSTDRISAHKRLRIDNNKLLIDGAAHTIELFDLQGRRLHHLIDVKEGAAIDLSPFLSCAFILRLDGATIKIRN